MKLEGRWGTNLGTKTWNKSGRNTWMRILSSLESIFESKSGGALAIGIRLGTSQHSEVYFKKKEGSRNRSWTNTLPLSYWANVEKQHHDWKKGTILGSWVGIPHVWLLRVIIGSTFGASCRIYLELIKVLNLNQGA